MNRPLSLCALFFLVASLLPACSTTKLSSTRAETPDPRKTTAKQIVDPALLSLLQRRDAEEREFFYIVALMQEEKAEKQSDRERAQEASAKPPEPPPTVLQETPGPPADDTLVDLWQKDF